MLMSMPPHYILCSHSNTPIPFPSLHGLYCNDNAELITATSNAEIIYDMFSL